MKLTKSKKPMDKFGAQLEQKSFMKRVKSAKSTLLLTNPVFAAKLEARQKQNPKKKPGCSILKDTIKPDFIFTRPQTYFFFVICKK